MANKKRPVKFTTGAPGIGGHCSTLQTHEGLFHAWGKDMHETFEDFETFTAAIIEMESGEIKMVVPERVTFLDK